MKRKLFLLLCALLTSVGMWAQSWTGGASDEVYLKNVGGDLFWGAANSWGTQASLTSEQQYVKFIDNGDGTYKMESMVSNGNGNIYFNGSYMDGDQPVSLTITSLGSGKYSIANGSTYYGWDGSSPVLATASDASNENFQWVGYTRTEIDALNATTLSAATNASPVDATCLILDAKFGRNRRDAGTVWTMTASNKNLNGGGFDGGCAESYHSSFELSQSLSKAPNGKYKLTAQAFYRKDENAGNNIPYIYITNGTDTPKSNFKSKEAESGDGMASAATHFKNGDFHLDDINIVKAEGQNLSVGAKLENETHLWSVWANFQLSYYGNAVEVYSPKSFDSGVEATEDTWYAFSVESAGVYKITSTAAATIRYTQNSSDDADTGGKTMSLATGGYTVMKLSAGTFYFKSDANSTITISTTLANGDDVTTAFITNPSFETEDLTGWTNADPPFSVTNGNDLDNKKDNWYATVNNNRTRSLTQTVSLSEGKYILSVNARLAKQGNNTGTATVGFGGNTTNIPNGRVADTYTVAYEAAEDVNVAISYNKTPTYTYHYFDNFTLTYYETLPDVSITDLTSSAMSADVRAALTSASSTYNDSKTVANYNALQTAIVNAKVSIADFAVRTGADADWTDAISNPSFETGNLSGWTNVGSIGTQSNDAFDPYKSGTYYAEKWHNSGNKSVKQSLILSAGTYKITAAAHASNDVTSPQLLAGSSVVAVREKAQYDVYFESDGTEAIEIGFGGTCTGSSWIAVDNFRLTYNPTLPVSISAVEGKMKATVASEQAAAVDAYNASSGQTIDNMVVAQAKIYAAQLSKQVYDEIATIRDNYQTKADALDAAGQAAYTTAINVASSGALTQYTEGTYTNTSEAEAAFSRDYGTALKAQTTPGTDLSELITNTNLYGKEFFNNTGDVNQTITSLSNGYYLITAQAYYRAGDKRTTGTAQNAKLYGNTTEVSVVNINTYTAQNIAPSNGGTWIVPTDCKFYVPDNMTAGNYAIKTLNAYHNSVAVNVTNGTLTLGIKKESTIEYDWTYWDNFKLIYLGESLPATLTGVSGDMNSEVSSAQESAVAAYNAVSGQTVANYNAAANAIIAAEASISLYNKISEDVTAYGEEAATLDAAGQTAYANEVVSINSKYSAGSYTSFGEADEELSAALLAAVKSQGAGSNWTKIITNPSFENSDMSCWTFDNITNTGDRRESGGGSDGSYHGAFWKENYNSASDQAPGLHQSVTLPAGFYRLEFDAYNHDGSGHKWKEVQLYFGATESDKLAYNTTYQSWRTFGFEFEVTETTTANLGAKFTPTENGSIWEHVDNFRLTYLGDASANMAVNATAKWGTFCAPFEVAIPDGVTAYTCASATDGKLVLVEVTTGAIPANTPVILNAESGLTSTIFYGKKIANESDDLIEGGLLVGNVSTSTKDVPSDGSAYLLQLHDNKVGFYKASGPGYLIGNNRCYLLGESLSDDAREAFFFEDDATAISALEAAKAEADAQKDGKYLINGKIVIVKNGVKYDANGKKLN